MRLILTALLLCLNFRLIHQFWKFNFCPFCLPAPAQMDAVEPEIQSRWFWHHRPPPPPPPPPPPEPICPPPAEIPPNLQDTNFNPPGNAGFRPTPRPRPTTTLKSTTEESRPEPTYPITETTIYPSPPVYPTTESTNFMTMSSSMTEITPTIPTTDMFTSAVTPLSPSSAVTDTVTVTPLPLTSTSDNSETSPFTQLTSLATITPAPPLSVLTSSLSSLTQEPSLSSITLPILTTVVSPSLPYPPPPFCWFWCCWWNGPTVTCPVCPKYPPCPDFLCPNCETQPPCTDCQSLTPCPDCLTPEPCLECSTSVPSSESTSVSFPVTSTKPRPRRPPPFCQVWCCWWKGPTATCPVCDIYPPCPPYLECLDCETAAPCTDCETLTPCPDCLTPEPCPECTSLTPSPIYPLTAVMDFKDSKTKTKDPLFCWFWCCWWKGPTKTCPVCSMHPPCPLYLSCPDCETQTSLTITSPNSRHPAYCWFLCCFWKGPTDLCPVCPTDPPCSSFQTCPECGTLPYSVSPNFPFNCICYPQMGQIQKPMLSPVTDPPLGSIKDGHKFDVSIQMSGKFD